MMAVGGVIQRLNIRPLRVLFEEGFCTLSKSPFTTENGRTQLSIPQPASHVQSESESALHKITQGIKLPGNPPELRPVPKSAPEGTPFLRTRPQNARHHPHGAFTGTSHGHSLGPASAQVHTDVQTIKGQICTKQSGKTNPAGGIYSNRVCP